MNGMGGGTYIVLVPFYLFPKVYQTMYPLMSHNSFFNKINYKIISEGANANALWISLEWTEIELNELFVLEALRWRENGFT